MLPSKEQLKKEMKESRVSIFSSEKKVRYIEELFGEKFVRIESVDDCYRRNPGIDTDFVHENSFVPIETF